MQKDHQTGSYRKVSHTTGDVVFAKTSDEEIWPAKIIRINKSQSCRVSFFARKELTTTTEDQVWPFNSLTIQRFVSNQSPVQLVQAIQEAQKYLEKKGNNLDEERHQMKVIRSLDQSVDDLSQDMLLLVHHSMPLSSKGLFVIHEVNENLEQSRTYLSYQHLKCQEPNDQSISLGFSKRKRRKTSDMLLSEEQEEIFFSQKTRIISKRNLDEQYSKRKSKKKNKKNQEKKMEKVQNLNLKIAEGSTHQEKTEIDQKQAEKTPEIPEEIRLSLGQEEVNPQQEPVEAPVLQLVYEGPLNLSQISTEATLHPETASIPSVFFDSTAATIADSLNRTSEQSSKSHQGSLDSNQTTNVPKENSCEIKDDKENGQESLEQSLKSFINSLKKILRGKRKKLTVKQQLKFCYMMKDWKLSKVSLSLLQQSMQLIQMFESVNVYNREKCLMQYMLVRQKMTNLTLMSRIQGFIEPKVRQFFQKATETLISDQQ